MDESRNGPRWVPSPEELAAPLAPPAPTTGWDAPAAASTAAAPPGRRVGRPRWWLVAGVSLAVATLAGGTALSGDDGAGPRDDSVLVLYGASEGIVGDAQYVRDGSPAAEDRVLHDQLWAEWTAMIPPYWSRRVERFEIATDGSGGIAAAVQRLDADGTRWLLSVDPVDAVERRDRYVHTLVHELAHIVTLGEGRVEVDPAPATTLVQQSTRCDGPAVPEGCAAHGSVLAVFTERFWDLGAVGGTDGVATSGDREDATIERYLAAPDSYVSAYAASDPVEDLAETFAALALDEPQPRGSVAAAKVALLRADAELFSLADRIRAALR